MTMACAPASWRRSRAGAPTAARVASSRRDSAAERLYSRALEILEKALGPDHPDVAAVSRNLAKVYRAQGRIRKAAQIEATLKVTKGSSFR